MVNKLVRLLLFGSLIAYSSVLQAQKSTLNVADFKNPPTKNQITTWWHWMSGFITKEGITKDLEAMKKQDIRCATILNVYYKDLGNADCPTVDFGSPQWYEMFKYALKEANRLGINIGAANCDGWSESGGPWINPENSMKQFIWRKTYLEGGNDQPIKLNQPIGTQDYYKDAYVIAYPSSKPNSFVMANPTVTYNGKTTTESLTDGSPISNITLKKNQQIRLQFNEPFTTSELDIVFFDLKASIKLPLGVTIESSNDNITFSKVADVVVDKQNELVKLPFAKTTATAFRLTVNDDTKVGEVALLQKGESNSYEEGISQIINKTVSSRVRNLDNYQAADKEPASNAFIANTSDVIDLTNKMDKDGNLNWKAPKGDWTILRFGYTTTGQTNHPASPQGTGLECDKMDTTALNIHFQNYPQKLIDLAGAYKGNTFSYILVDSWECGQQNWTANFAKEFEKRRGYSLIPYIPVLCGEVVQSTKVSEAFLHDYRQTISDLIVDYYFKHLADLCHRQGMELHSEGIYGDGLAPPIDILKTYKYCDMPMTEFWANIEARNWPINYVPKDKLKYVAPEHSALLYNKPIVGSEAYTGMAIYSDAPIDLKLYGDAAFTNGVNNMILHSNVHQPTEKKPGLTLGVYGQSFNRHNPWYAYGKSFFDEQARVQFLLQQGFRMSDALIYLGDKLPSLELNEKDLDKILPKNTKFNYCNSEVLLDRTSVKDGEILLDNKYPFQFLVVRDKELNLATVKKIEALVKAGATVFAPKPTATLSLKELDVNNAELKAMTDKVWGTSSDKQVTSNSYGKGKVVWSLDEIKKTYAPDFEAKGVKPDALLHIHKKLANGDVYYLVNTNDTSSISFEANFRVNGKVPTIWDPMDGKTYPLALYNQTEKYTKIPLTLRAKQSLFVVFTIEASKPYFISMKSIEGVQLFPIDGKDKMETLPLFYYNSDNKIVAQSSLGGKFILNSITGKESKINIAPAEAIVLADAKGIITFENELAIGTKPIDKFLSFTESSDSLVKYYSGEATYKMKVYIPSKYKAPNQPIYLQLEQFGATANIEINGKQVGIIWDPTYKMDITSFIKAGDNDFTIKVTNPWRNRLIGDKVKSRGEKDLWTTSPMIKKGDPIPIITKEANLFPSGISKPIKLYFEHPLVIDINH